jgi:tryptophanyl-tRNA synthetase
MDKKRIFSGIQPSGNLHIGNYLGAIKNWVSLQNKYDSIFCIVDLHAITVPQDPEELKKKTIEVAKAYLASGIDPKKSSIFIQSHISEHTELAWILNTLTMDGDLVKMTQFKVKTGFDEQAFEIAMRDKANGKITDMLEKKGVNMENDFKNLLNAIYKITLDTSVDVYIKHVKKPFNKTRSSLFDYPVLMAADIILYDAELVPVGEDQFQHVELTRTLANRFNKRFGETFKIPDHYKTDEGMRIMGLDNPSGKMSKSAASEYNYIALTDDSETIKKKIKKAVTDSGSEIKYEDSKPALHNLINIYSSFSGKSPKEIEKKYEGKGYADFKDGLAEVIIEGLKPIQEKMKSLTDEEVLKILKEGAEKVKPLAEKKMKEVKEKVGFVL